MKNVQENYISKKAIYETTIAAVEAACMNLDWDGDFDAAFDQSEAISAMFNLPAKSASFRNAEQELLSWAQCVAASMPTSKAQAAQITFLFGKLPLMPSLKDKAIDLALRLNA